MKKGLIFLLFSILIIFLLSLIILKKDYQIITAEIDKKTNHFYPKDCFVKFENKNYLTTNRWIYRWQILSKKITPHSESILVEKFDFFENHYSKEDKKYMFLHLDNKKDSIIYNGRSYTIDHVSGDSSFSKINDNEIIIFINSKNLD
jgi:hypothetical protein